MLILGCGYLGQRLLRQVKEPQTVTGVVRSAESVIAVTKAGARALRCDVAQQGLPPEVTQDELVLYFAPPPGSGDTDPVLQRFLQGLSVSGQPRRLLYISTTGVYGNCEGAWVDERHAVNPQAARARRRWDAEQALRRWREQQGGELVILRVAGIYGPGKLPLARLERQVPMVPESAAPWTNRIHVDDLASVVLALLEKGGDGEVYNVSDGTPGNMTDYFNRVADMAGLSRPPLIDPDEAGEQLSPGLLSYLAESRRLDNRKMLQDSGIRLRYPDLESGLPSCFED